MLRTILLAVTLLTAGSAAAETLYVNDMLRLGVRAEPASNEAPLTVVTTGAALEVLDRTRGYVKVRTEDGVVGWVNSVYVTGEEPARRRIEKLKVEHERVRRELEEMRASSSDTLESNAALRNEVNELRDENGKLHAQLAKVYQTTSRRSDDWSWLYTAAMIGLFVLGIVLGVLWHRQQIAQRLGGLKL